MSSSDRAQTPPQQLPEDEETAAALQSLRRSRAAASLPSKRRKVTSTASTSAVESVGQPPSKASGSASFPPEFLATSAFTSPRDFFVASDAHDGSAESVVVCTLCDAAIGSRVFTLKRHLYRHHPSVFRTSASLPDSSTDTLTTHDESSTVALLGPHTPRSAAEDALVAWLTADTVPVAALTSAHFQTFVQELNPGFKLPSAVTTLYSRPLPPPGRTMRGLCLQGDGSPPVLRSDLPVPVPVLGEALVRILRAGVCGTDLMMVGNYKPGFTGVFGHEFVGIVEQVGGSNTKDQDREWRGKRVVGEINVPCDTPECLTCRAAAETEATAAEAAARIKRRNHCPSRAAVGIVRKAGVFAEYATLPLANLYLVPDTVVDAHAVFAEPLAAACRIVEQHVIQPGDRVAVLGDGKLGLLVAEVLHAHQLSLSTSSSGGDGVVELEVNDATDKSDDAAAGAVETTLIGKYPAKLALMKGVVAHTLTLDELTGSGGGRYTSSFDVVVECTGSPTGSTQALQLLKPRGVLVAKSTCAATHSPIDARLAQAKQVRIVGSRCGPFEAALALLRDRRVDVQKFIHATYPLARAEAALAVAGQRGVLKVQLVVT